MSVIMDDEIDCAHIAEYAINVKIDVDEMRATLTKRSCNVCVRVDHLWICVVCKQILCGKNVMGHSTAHYDYHNTHCIFINIESAAIFCFKCGTEVEPKIHDDELNRLRQFILYNRGPIPNYNKISRPTAKKPSRSKRTSFKRRRSNKKVNIAITDKSVATAIQQELGNEDKGKKRPQKKSLKTAKPKKFFFKRGPRTNKKIGITNSGNNCFMNAVWQALRHLKPFIYCLKLFKASDLQKYNEDPKKQQRFIIAEELLKLLISLVDWQKPPGYKYRDAISPVALHTIVCKIKPRYKGFHQHDAHEFLMFTLDTLHSELRDEKTRLLLEKGIVHVDPNQIDTLVSVMFRGYLLSEVFCLNCKTPSRTKDPFSDISLHVPDFKPIENELDPPQEDLLTDCLARYIEVEELNEKNFYFCSKCESQQKSTKRFWINRLPNVLCLHLKRFRWDSTYRTKVHTHIKFPMHSLDMSQYLDSDMKNNLTKEASYLFDLVAVVVHDGEGGGSGHYTSYALDDKEGNLSCFFFNLKQF
ncbi:Hypothetical protein CINCED_3A007267 [Cinara cedri]|uniref:ubiquitinyl hydrolase 1 n=1 Tax=Cinara cedri TaxID=506608 RepID=A0A5E4LYE5_9HEMI|nr:Hypothetical protein CINCED_3A007267 [Cinara cedri]